MPCTYDLEVASARYLQALDDGTIPLLFLFSGTVFLAQGNGYAVELVPWSSEASYRMPVSVWQDVVNLHFPDSAWLRCSRETPRRPVRVQIGARPADLGRHPHRAAGAGERGAAERRRRPARTPAPEAPTVDAKPRDSAGNTAPAVDAKPRDSAGGTA